MTPEERMRLLRNKDEWTFTLARRASPFPARRQASPLLVSLATIAAVAVVGVIVFSIFGLGIRSARPVAPPVVPTQTSVPTPTESPTPTSSPTSTPTLIVTNRPSTPPAAAPTQPLGGDCEALATTKQLSTAAGLDVTLSPPGGDDTAQGPGYLSTTVDASWSFAARQSGGLTCNWTALKGSTYILQASVSMFPVGTPHMPTVNKLCTTSTTMLGDSGYPDCELVQIVNGTVLMGYVFSDSHATALAFSQKFVALFAASARAHAPARAVVASKGVWPLMVDCAAIKPATVDGATWIVKQAEIGYDGGAGNIVSRISGDQKDTLYCAAVTHDAPAGTPKSLQYTVYGGGAWMLDEYTAAGLADPVNAPGFDRAALVTTSDTGLQFLVLTRGSNLLAVSAYDYTNDSLDVSAAYPLATAMADALDKISK